MLSSAGDKLTRELVEYPIAASFACPFDFPDFNAIRVHVTAQPTRIWQLSYVLCVILPMTAALRRSLRSPPN
jgi:hypothetical protein